MRNLFSLLLVSVLMLTAFTGCDKTNKYNPAKGKDVINRLQSAENGGDSLELAKLAVEQYTLLKDRAGAMETMRKAVRFCSDIQDSRERIETYSQIADSYSRLNALVEARLALKNAMSAYQNWEDEKEAERAKSRKEPTQNDIEGLADVKLEILLNLAKAQMGVAPEEARKTLMLAKDVANCYSDVLMKVDKLLDLATTLGRMGSFDELIVVASEVEAWLNGQVPATAAGTPEESVAEADGAKSDDAGDSEEATEDLNAEETEVAEGAEEVESDSKVDAKNETLAADAQEIDAQQKGSRLSILAGVLLRMKCKVESDTKKARDVGVEILGRAAEVAATIDNNGKKAITLCDVALNYVAAGDTAKAKTLVAEAKELAAKADSATKESAEEAVTNAQAVVGQ